MKKVYSGAVMALPEKEEDLFERINERTAHRRAERERAEAEAKQINEALLRKRGLYSDGEAEAEEAARMDIRGALPWVAAVLLFVIALLLGRMM